jgi:hypothetical protein
MTEKWELCRLSKAYPNFSFKGEVMFYSSSGCQFKEFKPGQYDDQICQLLADGWEPFQVIRIPENDVATVQFFRRRVS